MATIRKKQKNADHGRVLVDKQLETLEKDISRVYSDAAEDVKQKFDNYTQRFKGKDKEMRSRVSEGSMSEEQYNSWRSGQMFQKGKYEAQLDDLTNSLTNADRTAMAMVRDQLPETYATSYNFGGYRGETYANAAGIDFTPFTIYDKNTVKILMKDNPDLIPWKTEPDIPKSKRWNRQHLQSAITQGVLQGESMDKIAERLLPIVKMDENAAIRTARTAVNGVENKARKDSVEALREDGINMIETWSCTYDSRTRESHVELDGQQPNEDGLFDNGCAYPGDPDCDDPAEVYNCRCSLLTTLAGIDHSKDEELYEKMMEEEHYDDWVKVKEREQEKELGFQHTKAVIDAKDRLHDLGFANISSGLSKLDTDLLNDTVSQLEKLDSKFGAIQEGMNLKTGNMDAIAYASHDYYNGKQLDLKLSTQYYNDNKEELEERVKESRDNGWLSPFSNKNADKYPVTHEYGHILQDSMIYDDKYREEVSKLFGETSKQTISLRDKYVKENDSDVRSQMRADIISIAEKNNPKFDLESNLSEYAKANDMEFFAEAFANSQCGKPNEIGKAMNEWLRSKGYDT